jgi:hypothetical protein
VNALKLIIAFLIFTAFIGIAGADNYYYAGSVSANTMYKFTVASARSDCRDVKFVDQFGNTITPSWAVLNGCANGQATLTVVFPSSVSKLIIQSNNASNAWISYVATGYANVYIGSISANRLTALNVATARSDKNDVRIYTTNWQPVTPSFWKSGSTSGIGVPVAILSSGGTYYILSGNPNDAGYSQSSAIITTSTINQQIYQTHGISFSTSFGGNGQWFKLYNTNGQYWGFSAAVYVGDYAELCVYHPAGGSTPFCSGGFDLWIGVSGTWIGNTLSYSLTLSNGYSQSYSASGVAITTNVYFNSTQSSTITALYDSLGLTAPISPTIYPLTAFPDTIPPTITNIVITVTFTSATVSATISDNNYLASYEIRINDNLAVSKTTSPVSSLNINESVAPGYFSKDVNIVTITAKDIFDNQGQNSTNFQRVYALTLVIFHTDLNMTWNTAWYAGNFSYLVLKNPAQNQIIDLKAQNLSQVNINLKAGESAVLEFRYANYATTFVNEFEPFIADILNTTVIRVALPPPQTLFQVVAYSSGSQRVAFIDPTSQAVGAVGTTKYQYEQYKAFGAWLKPGSWNVYTTVNGVPTFLIPVNPQTASAISMDALIASVSVPQVGFFSASISCRPINASGSIFEISFASQKAGALLLLVKESGVTKYSANASGDKLVVVMDASQAGFTSDRADIEGYVDGSLKAKASCYLKGVGGSYYLPEGIAIALALGTIFFSFTAVGFFTMFRIMLPFASLAALYITSVTEATPTVRFVQIISLIMFVISILFIIKWRD